jgi:hypothetical protein
MKIPRPIRILGWVVFPIALFIALLWGWYMIAADYGYDMVAGTYVYRGTDGSSTLVLRKDRSFVQERIRAGKSEYRNGTWSRVGEGGILLSKEFLEIGNTQPRPEGEAYGEIRKSFLELIPYLVLGTDRDNGRTFRRQFFHSATLERQ